jgi:UMF1 family MFS transporter
MSQKTKPIWSWALYDVGDSAFATVIMAGFFPLFFKTFWSAGSDVTVSTAQLGLINAGAGLAIALLAPILGSIADSGQSCKRFLGLFVCVGAAATASLSAVPGGAWQSAALLYGAGVIGFSGATIFYDALLPAVADEGHRDRVSCLGYALGYLGGGLVFALCVWLTLNPAAVGLVSTAPQQDRALVIRGSFLLTALWWGLFSLPLLIVVREAFSARSLHPVRAGLRQLWSTLCDLRTTRAAWLFLLAYWFYIDGVNTIIRMAVDYGLALGFAAADLITALLITQFVGFPCALLFGRLGERWGARRAIFVAIAGYLGIVLWGMFMTDRREFYVLAVLVGVFQGGIQALSRSFYARLIPRDKAAQFFGFYNMVGKYAAILGPVLMGVAGYATRSPRLGIATLSVFFVIGGVLLWRVREQD